MKKLIVIAITLTIAATCWYLYPTGGPVELSKEDSLRLVNLQAAVIMASADRDEFIKDLCARYGVTLETHNLDLTKGQFVPREGAK